MQPETWKQVSGFGNYKVSNLGRIKNKRTNKILTNCVDKDGYNFVGLYGDKGRKHLFIHRIVLEAFIGGQSKDLEGNHKDGIKTNNNINNLEWATRAENIQHAFRTDLNDNTGEKNPMYGKVGLRGEKHPQSKLSDNQRFVLYCFAALKIYNQQKIADMFNVSVRTVKYTLSKYKKKNVIFN